MIAVALERLLISKPTFMLLIT